MNLARGQADTAADEFSEAVRALPTSGVGSERTGVQFVVALKLHGIGDVRFNYGDFDGALKNYNEASMIWSRLRSSDPSNGAVQPGLAVAYERIGDAYVGLGDTESAMVKYEPSEQTLKDMQKRVNKLEDEVRMSIGNLDILIEELLSNDEDVELERDFELIDEKIGDALSLQGKKDEALDRYRNFLISDGCDWSGVIAKLFA